ncbi:MAG TPA: hypothetical protein VNX21_01205, partial [Candidatus Thermoplasmatota archaeon]|nr:hypothetical protein [Candidatus Thermoplasmatota archaeon]
MARTVPLLVALVLLASLLAAPATADEPPAPPQALSAAPEGEGIRLTWWAHANASNASLAGYRVYLVENGTRQPLGDAAANATTYLDAPLPYGVTRTYEVTALGVDGQESAPSNGATATTAEPPGAPRHLHAAGLPASIVLGWEAPAGGPAPTGYVVWRGTSPDAKAPWASVTATSFNDTYLEPGVTYHYQVRAYVFSGSHFVDGPFSNEASNRTGPPPSAPQDLQATASPGRVDLSWRPPAEGGGLLYRVYRANASGERLIAETNGTTYADAPVANLTTRAYRVAAVNAHGEGPAAGPVDATTPGAPPAPAWLRLQVLDGAIR